LNCDERVEISKEFWHGARIHAASIASPFDTDSRRSETPGRSAQAKKTPRQREAGALTQSLARGLRECQAFELRGGARVAQEAILVERSTLPAA
jgi:hypothetical protein